MIRRILSVFLVVIVLSVPLAANGQQDGAGSKTLTIWSFNLSPEALSTLNETVIPAFEAEHEGINVEWQNIPYQGYREKLLTAAAGASLPDIFLDGFNMLGTYHSAGIVQDVSDRVASWEQWNDIPESLQELTKYNGQTYGVPVRVKVYSVLINTKIFEENGLDPDNPPETWSEALAAAQKMVKVENDVVVQMGASGFYNTAALVRGFDIFVQQNGGRFLDDDGNPAFNNERGIEALDYLVKLYRTQEPEGAAPLDETVMRAFIAGKAGMSVMDSYDVVQIALQSGNTDFFKYAKVIKPFRSDRPDGKPISLNDGDMMFISNTSDMVDEAWSFIEYFYQPDNFMIYAKANKVVPIFKSQLDSEYAKTTPLFPELMEMQQYGGELPATPAYRSARQHLADEIEKAIYGGQSLEQTLARSEEIWLREIEELK